MPRAMPRASARWAVGLLCCVAAVPDVFAQSGAPEQRWVAAKFERKKDSLGFEWQVSDQGSLQQGTRQCFQQALRLRVSGNDVYPQQRMMTPDGDEFRFTANISIHQPGMSARIEICRRVKLDLESGTVRYVETFRNLSAAPALLNVNLMTAFRQPPADLLTDRGSQPSRTAPAEPMHADPFGGPSTGAPHSALGKKECGLYLPSTVPEAPAVLLFLAGPKSEMKPRFLIQGQQLTCIYLVSVPPHETVALVHGIAQRKTDGKPDRRDLAGLFRPMKSRAWIRDLPDDVRAALANVGRPSPMDVAVKGPLLGAVARLAGVYEVARDKLDVLVQDKSSKLSGGVSGDKLTVQTLYGESTVAWDDVAMVFGGAGIDRPMQVHLRNGEILAGPVQWREVTFVTEAGLEVPLQAEQINVLFRHADARDGTPPEQAAAFISTHRGDRLAARGTPETRLQVATAWGPLALSLSDVEYLYLTREPQPVHRLRLTDATRISAIVRGNELAVPSLRFGQVRLSPSSIARVIQAEPRHQDEDGVEDFDDEIKVPHVELVGENLLVGTLQASRLQVFTAAGPTPLSASSIRSMELREETGEPGAFAFELRDGSSLAGRIPDRVLAIESRGEVWQVPVHQIVAYRQPTVDEDEIPVAPANAAGEPKPDGTMEEDGPNSEPETPASKPVDPFSLPPAQPHGGSPFVPEAAPGQPPPALQPSTRPAPSAPAKPAVKPTASP